MHGAPVLIPGQLKHCLAAYVGCRCFGDTHRLSIVLGSVRCGKGAYVESDTENRIQLNETAHRRGSSRVVGDARTWRASSAIAHA